MTKQENEIKRSMINQIYCDVRFLKAITLEDCLYNTVQMLHKRERSLHCTNLIFTSFVSIAYYII